MKQKLTPRIFFIFLNEHMTRPSGCDKYAMSYSQGTVLFTWIGNVGQSFHFTRYDDTEPGNLLP